MYLSAPAMNVPRPDLGRSVDINDTLSVRLSSIDPITNEHNYSYAFPYDQYKCPFPFRNHGPGVVREHFVQRHIHWKWPFNIDQFTYVIYCSHIDTSSFIDYYVNGRFLEQRTFATFPLPFYIMDRDAPHIVKRDRNQAYILRKCGRDPDWRSVYHSIYYIL